MHPSTEAAIVAFCEAGTRYFNIHAGVKLPTKGKAPKAPKKEKAAPVPAPEPETMKGAEDGFGGEDAAPKPLPVPAARVISLDEAKAVAREYIQRFQKQDPDGMARIRVILKSPAFQAETLSALTPEKLGEFATILEAEMGEAK